MTTGTRYYVSVNFICDTDGSEGNGEPSTEQLDQAFRTTVKDNQIEFEIWDERKLDDDEINRMIRSS